MGGVVSRSSASPVQDGLRNVVVRFGVKGVFSAPNRASPLCWFEDRSVRTCVVSGGC